jgi:hypothetical protein
MKPLFGKDEFVLAGNLQPVFFAGMLDNNNASVGKKFSAGENAPQGRVPRALCLYLSPVSGRGVCLHYQVSFPVIARSGFDTDHVLRRPMPPRHGDSHSSDTEKEGLNASIAAPPP